VLAPISFLSVCDPPVPPQAPWLIRLRALGPGVIKWLWDIGHRQTLAWVKPVLELRKELGLGSGKHPLFEGSHSPSLVLALFSRHLAAPQPDWPAQTVVTGFPLHNRGELAPELLRFLEDGPAPVVFTLGSSAVGAAGGFYLESLAAVERLGCRAVFLTGSHRQGLPEALPPDAIAVPYAPHGAIFPRAAAIVHQGGIGTTAQAMRSGRPMLVVPFGHDQFDNAARLRRLGAAEVLYRSRYGARRVAHVLRRLMQQASFAQAAAELGEKVRAEDGAGAAADAIAARLSSVAALPTSQ
jgi:UDP:flavonoid glycosyltransferase YjiC (YdhE family)